MDTLFGERRISDVLSYYPKLLAKEVDELPVDRIKDDPIENLLKHFTGKFALDVPVLATDKIEADSSDVKLSINYGYDHPSVVEGTRFTFFVPFTGDGDIFKFRPNRYSLNPPRAVVRSSELQLIYDRTDHNVEQVKQEFNRELASIQKYLEDLRSDVANWNSSVEATARGQIEARRQKLVQDAKAAESLGLPVRRRPQ